MDRARDKEWGKGILDYRDVVYTRHYDLDLSPMVIYFTAFFNMGDPVDPPPAIVQASLPLDKKTKVLELENHFQRRAQASRACQNCNFFRCIWPWPLL